MCLSVPEAVSQKLHAPLRYLAQSAVDRHQLKCSHNCCSKTTRTFSTSLGLIGLYSAEVPLTHCAVVSEEAIQLSETGSDSEVKQLQVLFAA